MHRQCKQRHSGCMVGEGRYLTQAVWRLLNCESGRSAADAIEHLVSLLAFDTNVYIVAGRIQSRVIRHFWAFWFVTATCWHGSRHRLGVRCAVEIKHLRRNEDRTPDFYQASLRRIRVSSRGIRHEHVFLTVHVETETLSFSAVALQARLPFSHSVTAVWLLPVQQGLTHTAALWSHR